MTSLHRILPAITMGYSLFDLIEGMKLSLDFVLHGAATLSVMAFYCEMDAPEIVAPMLLMEVSTIFLTVVRADFFTAFTATINQVLFVVIFSMFRCAMVPYIWVILVKTIL